MQFHQIYPFPDISIGTFQILCWLEIDCLYYSFADEDPGFTAVLVGIGINVNDNPHLIENLRENATSISNEIGHMVSREMIVADICNHLEVQCDLEMETILETFQSLHLWNPGSWVEVFPRDDGATYRGVVQKVENDGTLKITGTVD
jgi:biotin-(acetyl-CoA carboxylase) ligase